MISFFFQDWRINNDNTKGRIIALLFRIANYSTKGRLAKICLSPYLIFYKILVEWFFNIEIPYNVTILSGLKIYHGHSLVIHCKVEIGKNCILRQSTTIGNNGKTDFCPIIGNNVSIGANCCLIGDIIIGDNVTIGAGSIVVRSVPPNSTVVGNPARIIIKKI
jgi:putative colanic acid biosynthesis acetyltransferase WcaB